MSKRKCCPTCQTIVKTDDILSLLSYVSQIRVALGGKKSTVDASNLKRARSSSDKAVGVLVRFAEEVAYWG